MRRVDPAEVASRLAGEAEAVCRRYLSKGRRNGRYWTAGDVANTPGNSLFVRLTGPASGAGAAGRWTDAATGQHGDLLDLIGHAIGATDFTTAMDEACAFLNLPRQHVSHGSDRRPLSSSAARSEAARRLFAQAVPVSGTLADIYLRTRGLHGRDGTTALRFHPRCFYTGDAQAAPEKWPAMIAAVTDSTGSITGVQRTWLARDGGGKAPLVTSRRALGQLLGHAVRFGGIGDVMAAGEGIETMLSLRQVLPALPIAAALSASNLAMLHLPPTLRRLYIARDGDRPGTRAAVALTDSADATGIEVIVLSPERKDFNDDLRAAGPDSLRARLRVQMVAEDAERYSA